MTSRPAPLKFISGFPLTVTLSPGRGRGEGEGVKTGDEFEKERTRILPVLFLLFLTASFPSFLFALDVPERPEGYVSDYAKMVSPSAEADLEKTLEQFETETTNQVVVVTFPSLEGENLEDFSILLAEKWKIGQEGRDNGVILAVFKNDRKVRIEVGYGLEGTLPDATAKLIIENEIVPRFRAGQFDEGVRQGVTAILAATRGEYRAEASSGDGDEVKLVGILLLSSVILGLSLSLFLLWCLFGFGIVIFVMALSFSAGAVVLMAFFLGMAPLLVAYLLGRHGGRAVVVTKDGFRASSGGFGGWGGGGFSGGGGSFGGGGASGGW